MQEFFITNTVVSWIVIIFNLLVSLALVRRLREVNKGNELDILKVGTQAPDFSLPTLDGKTATLADYANQESLMVFVSPTCNPCRAHMSSLKELFPRIEADGIRPLIISLGAKDETLAFMEEYQMQTPVFVAEYGSTFASDYKVAGTPSYYHIDKKGQISAGGFFDNSWTTLIQKWT